MKDIFMFKSLHLRQCLNPFLPPIVHGNGHYKGRATDMYITTYSFKATVAKSKLLGFIANVPAELYCFVIPKTAYRGIYGHVVSTDVIEYFVSDCIVESLEIIEPKEIVAIMDREDCTVWGNRSLFI